jgi:hypothetical protein
MYAAKASILPIEYMIANLAGLPVAKLKNAPNDNICMRYPKVRNMIPKAQQMANPISLSFHDKLGKHDCSYCS